MKVPFSQIQAHVLLVFDEPFQRLLFFRIEDATKFKQASPQLLQRLTWAADVTERRAAALNPEVPLEAAVPKVALCLAYRSFVKLGAPPADLEWLKKPRDRIEGLAYYNSVNTSSAFHQDCFLRSNPVLWDPVDSHNQWKVGGAASLPDGVLVVAARTSDALLGECETLKELLRESSAIIYEEEGRVLEGEREHFGYMDGVAVPVAELENSDRPDHRTLRSDVSNGTQFYAGETLLLTSSPESGEPADMPPWLEHGSFLVFRRLEQRVADFHDALRRLALQTGRSSTELAARLMGRHMNGTPLIPSKTGTDGFDYAGDPNGKECPFSAHIRRVNPRDPENPRPLYRRSIPYGPPSASTLEAPREDAQSRGLLFMCYQASIERQFEHVSWAWMNSNGRRPVDALTGRRTGQTAERDLDLGFGALRLASFVHATGGGYFMALSKRGFQALFV